MRRNSGKCFCIIAVGILMLSGCGIKTKVGDVKVSYQTKKTIESMSTEEKLCQMLMPSMRKWSDTPSDQDSFTKVESLNDEITAFLTEYNFGGVILFAENCTGTEQLALLTSQMQEAARASNTGIPMLLSIDQEGGYITRLATGTSGVGNMALAATDNKENAFKAADIIGKELSALGVTTDFGPDADVNNNPDNTVIGIRSFSDDPQVVSEYAKEYIKGLQENNVMSCVKHFPGHGDTETDSHFGFPYIDKSLNEMNSLELVPFRALSGDTDMVMTAHIQFPQIETTTYKSVSTGEDVFLPATLSKTIITDILRNDIGFNGVVTTDALDMGAITDNFDRIDAGVMAINADVDLLLIPISINSAESIEDAKQYISEMTAAIEDGRISEEQLDDSVARILNLKEKYELDKCFETDRNEKVSKALAVVGSKENHDIEWQMALDAVTKAKGENAGNRNIDKDTNILIVCPWDSQLKSAEFARQQLVRDGILTETQNYVTRSYDGIETDGIDDYENDIAVADVVVVVSKTSAKSQLDLSNPDNINALFCKKILDKANETGKKTVVISCQLPYDADTFDADSIYLCYNPTSMTEIPTEYNGEVKKYGPNLPAAIYVALAEQ